MKNKILLAVFELVLLSVMLSAPFVVACARCSTEGDTIFDDGIWWIEEDSSEPHLGWIKVYVDGEYKGECSRLDFGHKVEGANSWPAVAAIYASGYIRLKECREPDVNFSTSFVLGPAYWEGGIYHHHPQIKEIHVNTSGTSSSPLSLEITADMEHLNITYNITMSEPTSEVMELDVEQIFEVANPFVLNESRFENHEGFKLVQFSSMYIDDYYHDSDGVRYIDETGKLVTVKFQEVGKGRFVFDDPQRLGRNWFECMHSDDEGWQGNTPNCVILLRNSLLATECTPQGWINDTSDPNDDNAGLWIHFDNASLEWNIGDGNSISYRLIARDNSMQAPNGSWVWVRDTVTGAWGEAVVGTGDAVYVARKTSFYRYDPADNSWTALAAPPNPDSGDAFKTGTALAWDFGDYIYALYGAATVDNRRWFYRYSISGNFWQALANTTADQGEGDAITYNGTYIYATVGGEQRSTYFVRYDPSTNSWSDEPTDPPLGMGDGASLVWTGGDFIYALRGEFDETTALYDFWRYSLTDDVWAAMADIPADPHDGGVGGVGDGGSLLYAGFWLSTHTDCIYALSGNQVNEVPDNHTYRYTISMNNWERLADLPFEVGYYIGCRLGYADGHIYAWQGTPSTWTGGGDDLARYKLDYTPPTIGILNRTPSDDVQPEQTVKISVNVTDIETGVKNVTLFYTINNGTNWENLTMDYNVSINMYEATIPGQQAGTWVKFKIVAYDYTGNNSTRDGTEPYCIYQVIPEFPSNIISLLFMVLTMLTILYVGKRVPTNPKN